MTRFAYVMATTLAAEIAAGLFIAVAYHAPRPRLTWNPSASAPVGLYRVTRDTAPVVGDLVLVMPPAGLADYMDRRHYLPVGVPLLKHVAATAGAKVCRIGFTVTINGRPVARALLKDRQSRRLPVWRGCHILGAQDLFLLNATPDSMDGRYFGLLPTGGVLGRATPILTRDAPGQPLQWRGFALPPHAPSALKGSR